MRLFFAVGLEPEAVREVSALMRALQKQASDPGLRWERPDHLHYTLQFLGEVEESRLSELKDAASLAVSGAQPFSLGLHGLGAFPAPRNPRVLWLGAAEGGSSLCALAANLSRQLQAIGFEPERRPFAPHLTIARVKGAPAERAAARLLQSISLEAVAVTRVASMVLMQSVLSPKGSEYSVLADFKL